jgi:plastocyanin
MCAHLKCIGFSMLIFITHCSTRDKKQPANNDYGDYEIAEPNKEQPNTNGQVHTIEIKGMKFEPEEINVKRGDEIIWINKDIVAHDVTEQKSNKWTSSKLEVGSSWRMAATKSEIYYCSIHVVMKGKIIVDGDEIAMRNETDAITMCN